MATSENLLILVVDDDKNVSSLMEQVLKGEGYNVQTAPNIFRAQGILQRSQPDLIILDRRLPDGDGIDFCMQIRKDSRTHSIPVLFLTATKKGVPDKVLGLEVGGDDYLTKPFSPEELSARVKAILRRTIAPASNKSILEAGLLRLDLDARKAYANNKELSLWPKEYDLLATFLERMNRVLTREFLLQRVWGAGKEMELNTNVVDVTVGNLRKKLGKLGENIVAVRGFGFRFDFEGKK
ncbi:MAG: response regulator transcription factor [Elusimicrobia bacterium]|nr:response regulator transcription factor [Elusimicrobiota bacterium]